MVRYKFTCGYPVKDAKNIHGFVFPEVDLKIPGSDEVAANIVLQKAYVADGRLWITIYTNKPFERFQLLILHSHAKKSAAAAAEHIRKHEGDNGVEIANIRMICTGVDYHANPDEDAIKDAARSDESEGKKF